MHAPIVGGARPTPPIACREITEADLPAVIALLCEGFPARNPEYWASGLRRLAAQAPHGGPPRFGHVLLAGGEPVGVLLLIPAPGAAPRINVSSWYVRPPWRAFAAVLNQRALRQRDATYLNISPAPHTRPVIEALGFRRLFSGLFAGALLPRPFARASVQPPGSAEALPDGVRWLLADHEQFGCFAVLVDDAEGVIPFLFRRRWLRRLPLPCAMLIHAPSLAHVERCAAPLAAALLARGLPLLLISSPRPIRGFPGRHFPHAMPIYAKGEEPYEPGDLSYTEAAVFGI